MNKQRKLNESQVRRIWSLYDQGVKHIPEIIRRLELPVSSTTVKYILKNIHYKEWNPHLENKKKENFDLNNMQCCYEVIYMRKHESKIRTIYVLSNGLTYVAAHYREALSIKKLGKGKALDY